MASSQIDPLVIGISSRALLRLERENQIYEEQGLAAFIDYQRQYESEPPERGVAFPLIEALLRLNDAPSNDGSQLIEVVIVSKNHPECAIRISQSLAHHGLKVRRAVFTGGLSPLPYLKSHEVDLFLSSDEADVREAICKGFSAGLIYGGPEFLGQQHDGPVIAFDGDSTIFSDEADAVFRTEQLSGLIHHERRNASVPLQPGPMYKFLTALQRVRSKDSPLNPSFRIALVTARDLELCERPIRTLRKWGVQMDHASFCSKASKTATLEALQPLIFFDDSETHCDDARECAPTARIPKVDCDPRFPAPSPASLNPVRRERFVAVCKLFLKKSFADHSDKVQLWYEENLQSLDDDVFGRFNSELERSVDGTPAGRQRRAPSAQNEDFIKLKLFMENVLRKHSS